MTAGPVGRRIKGGMKHPSCPVKAVFGWVLAAWLSAALCVVLFLAAPMPPAARAQSSYLPNPPLPDSILPESREIHDPRIAPRDAWNPISKDPHVPKNEYRSWVNQDYFTVITTDQGREFLQVVERPHLGPKTNPRGFWKFYNAGRYMESFVDLRYVLCIFPNHPRALQLLCQVSKQVNMPDVPIAYFEKAIKLFPERGFTHAQYGAYLVDMGEATAGILELQKALNLDPDLLQARAWLTKARRQLGLPDTSAVIGAAALSAGSAARQ